MIRLCSIFLFICLGLSGQTLANQVCENPVFGVSGMKIDETATTASQAQMNAMDNAQISAFQKVLDRLLISKEPTDTALQAQDFIELVHIQTETSLPGRYIAEIDVCFSALMMRRYFIDNQLSWAEVKSPPVLVLPVFASPAGVRAWQKNQPWLMSWQEAVAVHDGLVDFKMLKASLANERQLQAERLFTADEKILAKAGGRANAEQILLIRAQEQFVDDKPILVVRGDLHSQDGTMILSLLQREIELSSFVSVADRGKLYQDIITEIINQLESAWRNSNARTQEFANSLIVHLAFDDLNQWVTRKRQIENTKAVMSVSLLSLSKNKAVLSLELAGAADTLRYSLVPIGLELEMIEGVGYIDTIGQDNASAKE